MRPIQAAMVVLLSGTTGVCLAASPPTDTQVHEAIERTIAEEAGSQNLCAVSRIDLDGDGSDEAVFTFMVGSHGSQVRAVSWNGSRERILFGSGSNTPNTDFVRVNDIPAIVLEQSDYAPDYVLGVRTQQVYLWDGRTFTHEPRYDCELPNMTTENGAIYSDDAHCRPKRERIPTTPCSG